MLTRGVEMKRKVIAGMTLTLLLTSMLTLAFNIQPVKADWTWTETIYIRADGSIAPDTAPISSADSITYTITDNIIGVPNWESAIVVERDNIVVDGASYTLQATGAWRSEGIDLTGRSNVTIKNMEIRSFQNGIWLDGSFNIIISGNNITHNTDGILLEYSTGSIISGNNITFNDCGITLSESSNNAISGNNITNNNQYGINLRSSSNVTLKELNICDNNGVGISLYAPSSVEILKCCILNNEHTGISCSITAANDVHIAHCDISGNGEYGVYFLHGSAINIVQCNISNNGAASMYGCDGIQLDSSDSQITGCAIYSNNGNGIGLRGSTNTVSDCRIWANDGNGIWLRSTNSSVSDCNIYSNDGNGIHTEESPDNLITNCTISDNYGHGIIHTGSGPKQISDCNIHFNYEDGIHLKLTGSQTINQVKNCKCSHNKVGIHIGMVWGSHNYEITNCKILNNDRGIDIHRPSQITECDIANNNEGIVVEWADQHIYRNNIINNSRQAVDEVSNFWDNGTTEGGNYWSDHECEGNPSNGSQPYIIDVDSMDRYPFENPSGWTVGKLTPVASWTYSPRFPENPIVGQTITFNASSSYDLDGTIVSYEWDFGDGTSGTGKIVTHSYTEVGYYVVILAVIDNEERTDTDKGAIPVRPEPKTIYVDDDFEDDPLNHKWDTVTEGVSDASSSDTVFVHNGEYYETVEIYKKLITLTGESRESTIVDGSITISDDWTTVSNLQVRTGGLIVFSSNNELRNCAFLGNGSGIRVEWPDAAHNHIADCTVSNNSGCGIYLSYTSHNVIENSTISGNGQHPSYPDAGIKLWRSTHNNIINCNISRNQDDGIVFDEASDSQIINCDIDSNGLIGICARAGRNNQIKNCSVWNNEGGIYSGSNDNVLRDNRIWNNTYNFGIYARQDVDTSNTINGKPIYYLIGEEDLTIDGAISDVGYLGLESCDNITVRNLNISQNYQGLLLTGYPFGTTNSVIENCCISDNIDGIDLSYYSSHNDLSDCEISNNVKGIHIGGNGNNITNCDVFNNSETGIFLNSWGSEIANCNISLNGQGVYIHSWVANKITSCSISRNTVGIYTDNAFYQQIEDCNVSHNENGIIIHAYGANEVIDCKITDNEYGMRLEDSGNNLLRGNSMANNEFNFAVWGGKLSNFLNNVDASNTVDDKPVYYLIDKQDMEIPLETGYVALVNCKNITVENLDLDNNGAGILLVCTKNSTIAKNRLVNNEIGIYLRDSSYNIVSKNNIKYNEDGITLRDHSSYNTISENNVVNNDKGISLSWSTANNVLYHNDFVDNTEQVSLAGYAINSWDDSYPSGGNYWSDYTDVDVYSGPYQDMIGSDGIWDHPYEIDWLGYNIDNYPLVEPWSPVISAATDVDPDTLNLKSKGRWITSYIQLLEGYSAEDIDAATTLLNEIIPPVLDPKYDFVTNSSEYLTDHDNDGILERMVKFSRPEVTCWVYSDLGMQYGDVTLAITGELSDGTRFEGTCTIKVLFPGDADDDGDVDFDDFIILAACYGMSIKNPDYDPLADFDEDGYINYDDFLILAGNYGKAAV